MEKYLRIENSDGKVWLLPEGELRTALCLYQPSSAKGKFLKFFLPAVNRFSCLMVSLYTRVGLRHISYSVEEEIKCYLEELFRSDDLIRYAIFLGTPSVHQKTTIQIFAKENIYGYCKISNSVEIYSIFKHEEQVLHYLHEHGINNVPQCISCKEISKNKYSFVQTTTKTIKSTIHHELSVNEIKFLTELAKKTAVRQEYEQTDFFQSVNRLKEGLPVLIQNGYDVYFVERAVERIEEFYKKQSVFCVCHRDFTPWNMFYNSTELFVFDFEYACFEYPPYLDAIHFVVQTAIFEKKLNADQILQEFKLICEKGVLKDVFEDDEMAFLGYLVDIISMYVDREKRLFSGDVKKSMDIWMELCKELVL